MKAIDVANTFARPAEPATPAAAVRQSIFTSESTAHNNFSVRLRADADALAMFRMQIRHMRAGTISAAQSCAHKLAGAAGIYGFHATSCAAAALEQDIIDLREDRKRCEAVESSIDLLVASIELDLAVQLP